MERNVYIYSGSDIDKYCIERFKTIKKSVISDEVYLSNFDNINSIYDLAMRYDFKVDDLNLILGEDWTILYAIENDFIYFLEWAGINNNKTKFIQTIEMINTFKYLLLDNRDKFFCANMKHTTSYKFYSKMVNDNYFEESINKIDNYYELFKGKNLVKFKFAIYKEKVDELLNSGIIINRNELDKVFHFVVFKVTDKFINKYLNSNILYKKKKTLN